MGFQTDLIQGVALLIQGAGIAQWDPAGTYTGTLPHIFVRVAPATPDDAVTIATYGVSDDPRLSTSVIGVQIMSRRAGRDPSATDDLADAIFNLLHGAHDLTLSTGVRVVVAERHSSIPLGRDNENRWSQSDNYYMTVWRPSTNRL